MTQPALAAAASERPFSARLFLNRAVGFWTGPDRRNAWLWTAGALALVFANLAVNVGINRWNKWFFDALERKDGSTLWTAVIVIVVLVALGAAFAVAMVWCRMTLQVKWRQWLTGEMLARWLSEQRYYRLAVTDEDQINPEYRIADDLRLASEPVVEFAVGFINALLAAVTFVGILFWVGGSLTIDIGGTSVWIPGYIAIAAVLYATATSVLTYLIGSPLVDRVAAKNEAEAQFRYELTRVRENAESIALIKGADDERERLNETFATVAARWLDVVRQHCHLTWILNGNAFFAPVFPVLLAAPKYLAGELSLGSVMQIAAAFIAVLTALNWFAENFIRLAEWSASARRAQELHEALDEMDDDTARTAAIVVENTSQADIEMMDLSIVHRDGRVVIDDTDIKVKPGERVLLGGESGSGKSTLIRAIAGLWPWGEGRILLPAGAKVAFVPQRPYIPLGTLRNAITYSTGKKKRKVIDDTIKEAMRRCGLRHLLPRLDAEERWDKVLSGGEQQRVAFTRLVVLKPDIVIMDEATSALDEDAQASMMELFRHELKDVTLISVGHRPGLEEFHERKLTLQRHPSQARQQAPTRRRRGARLLSRLLRRSLRPRPSPDPSRSD